MLKAKYIQTYCHVVTDTFWDGFVGRYGFSDSLWFGGLHCFGLTVDPDWQTTRVALGASSPLAHLACGADGFCRARSLGGSLLTLDAAKVAQIGICGRDQRL